MQFQENDRDVLTFLHRFGWGTVHLLVRAGFWSYPKNAYRRLKQLKNADLIEHHRIFRARPGAYQPTSKGCRLSESLLPKPPSPRLDLWDHDLAVAYLLLQLTEEHPGSEYRTEREIRSSDFSDEVTSDRAPDGMILFPDGRRWAVEYENSPKKKIRLKNIMANEKSVNGYGPDLDHEYEKILWFASSPRLLVRVKECVPEKEYMPSPASFDIPPRTYEAHALGGVFTLPSSEGS